MGMSYHLLLTAGHHQMDRETPPDTDGSEVGHSNYKQL